MTPAESRATLQRVRAGLQARATSADREEAQTTLDEIERAWLDALHDLEDLRRDRAQTAELIAATTTSSLSLDDAARALEALTAAQKAREAIDLRVADALTPGWVRVLGWLREDGILPLVAKAMVPLATAAAAWFGHGALDHEPAVTPPAVVLLTYAPPGP